MEYTITSLHILFSILNTPLELLNIEVPAIASLQYFSYFVGLISAFSLMSYRTLMPLEVLRE